VKKERDELKMELDEVKRKGDNLRKENDDLKRERTSSDRISNQRPNSRNLKTNKPGRISKSEAESSNPKKKSLIRPNATNSNSTASSSRLSIAPSVSAPSQAQRKTVEITSPVSRPGSKQVSPSPYYYRWSQEKVN